MNSDNHNNVGHNNSSTSFLGEAYELARNRKWTRDFAIYIMFCQAMAAEDKMKAQACMNLLEREVMNSLADPVFKAAEKEREEGRWTL